MDYIFNFPIVLRHWDKLAWGSLLSLELAALSILIGAAIGLALAVVHNDGPRWARMTVRRACTIGWSTTVVCTISTLAVRSGTMDE